VKNEECASGRKEWGVGRGGEEREGRGRLMSDGCRRICGVEIIYESVDSRYGWQESAQGPAALAA